MAIGGKSKKNSKRGGEKQVSTITELQKETDELKYRNSRDPSYSSSDDEAPVEEKLSNPAAAFIDISNPNRSSGKQTIKLKDLNINEGEGAGAGDGRPEALNRREREAVQKQQAKAHYMKMTAEGKTDQARGDLARLAMIRKQRDEAKAKREGEANIISSRKDESLNAGKSIINKTLGKK